MDFQITKCIEIELHILMFYQSNHFPPSPCTDWLCAVTSFFQLDLHNVPVEPACYKIIYLGQRSFSSKVKVRTPTHVRTHDKKEISCRRSHGVNCQVIAAVQCKYRNSARTVANSISWRPVCHWRSDDLISIINTYRCVPSESNYNRNNHNRFLLPKTLSHHNSVILHAVDFFSDELVRYPVL